MNKLPSFGKIGPKASFGTVLSRWKDLDSATTKDDRTSLVAMAARHWRRKTVRSNSLGSSNNNNNHGNSSNNNSNESSIRVFQSKRFQKTLSKRNLGGPTGSASTLETLEGSELDWSEHVDEDPAQWIANRSVRTRSRFSVLNRLIHPFVGVKDSFQDQYEVGKEVRVVGICAGKKGIITLAWQHKKAIDSHFGTIDTHPQSLFYFLPQLGKGASAVVHTAHHKRTDTTYAVKIISTNHFYLRKVKFFFKPFNIIFYMILRLLKHVLDWVILHCRYF